MNDAMTKFLNLEITALQADGKGKIISSPRVITADNAEAIIEQGTEIPYQQATSSGATSVSFRKATLSLKVKPQITPDDNIIMKLNVNKDSVGANTSAGPAIDTKQVSTEVLVENGGTVGLGGIYTQNESSTITKVPLLGDIPILGFFFRQDLRSNNKNELLIFVTPRIIKDALTIREIHPDPHGRRRLRPFFSSIGCTLPGFARMAYARPDYFRSGPFFHSRQHFSCRDDGRG
jgi:type IV pilus assembly protein PilQ